MTALEMEMVEGGIPVSIGGGVVLLAFLLL